MLYKHQIKKKGLRINLYLVGSRKRQKREGGDKKEMSFKTRSKKSYKTKSFWIFSFFFLSFRKRNTPKEGERHDELATSPVLYVLCKFLQLVFFCFVLFLIFFSLFLFCLSRFATLKNWRLMGEVQRKDAKSQLLHERLLRIWRFTSLKESVIDAVKTTGHQKVFLTFCPESSASVPTVASVSGKKAVRLCTLKTTKKARKK